MAPPRILVTGAHGRLGSVLCEILEEEGIAGEPVDVIAATRDEIDITDYFRLCAELERIEPGVIVNCAALADVDGCEERPELAERVNAEGARDVARAARTAGARLIHISTDLVFDGETDRPYTEDDEPRPLSTYAMTKLRGEQGVAEEDPEALILRSSWFFGPRPATVFPESFLARLRQGHPVRMVADRLGSPTYLRDLARAIGRLAVTPHRGVLHFANAGEPASRYDVLSALAERLRIPTASLRPIAAAVWDGDVAPRPIFSALDATRYAAITGEAPRPWEAALDDYLEERER